VGGLGGSLTASGVNAVLGGVTQWVVDGAVWLLQQVGAVLTTTTSVDLTSGWFESHYRVMAALTALVLLPLLLASLIQAVYRQSLDGLWRLVLVQLPLAFLLTGAAVQVTQLAVAATDALCSAVTVGGGQDLRSALSSLASTLGGVPGQPGLPAFVAVLGALLVGGGALVLWLELVVRAAAVYAAVLFLPLALASLVWPAVSHWCRRLIETLAALILSKFVIVAVLSMATGALSSGLASGGGFSAILAGGALLLLATFTPFTLLRLIPAVEAGAVSHLEGARHRVQHALTDPPRGAAQFALRHFGGGDLDPGAPGTGTDEAPEAPGPSPSVPGRHPGAPVTGGGRPGPENGSAGLPEWNGDPGSAAEFDRALTSVGSRAAPAAAPPLGAGPPTVTDEPGGAGAGPDDALDRRPPPWRWRSVVVGSDDLGPVITWRPDEDGGDGGTGT
jgi:hypothetical protein